jgi:hypothetical protein
MGGVKKGAVLGLNLFQPFSLIKRRRGRALTQYAQQYEEGKYI